MGGLENWMEFAPSSVEYFRERCMAVAEELGKEPSNQFCLNDCFMCQEQGDCVNGQCECRDGFQGDDCSIAVEKPAVMTPNHLCCDPAEDPECFNFLVTGSNFAGSPELSCALQIGSEVSLRLIIAKKK